MVKSTVEISQNFMTISKYMNFTFQLIKSWVALFQGLLKEHVLLLITIELAPSFPPAMIEMYLLKYVLINVKLRSYDIINPYNFNLKSIMWH